MGQLIPHGQPLMMPRGTRRTEDGGTWALYVNDFLSTSWLVWSVPAGFQVMTLPGRRSVHLNTAQLAGFVSQQRATACCGKGD